MTKAMKPWTPEDDAHIAENYTGILSVIKIANDLGRTYAATDRRVKIILNLPMDTAEDKNKIACIEHGEDLRLSGGRWS